MVNVLELAAAEAAAYEAREDHELECRRVWWQTTRALPDSSKEQVEQVARILGLRSIEGLRVRARIARKVDPALFESGAIYRVMPAMAREWVKEGQRPIDAAAVEELVGYEDQRLGTRGLSIMLGKDRPGRTLAPQREEQIEAEVGRRLRQPEVIREAVRREPDVARAIARDPHASAAISEASANIARERTPAPRQNIAEDRQADGRNRLYAALYAAHRQMSDAHRALNDVALTSEIRDGVIGLATTVRELADSFVDRLEGDREFDAALRQLTEVQH